MCIRDRAGTVLQAGLGKMNPAAVPALLQSRNRGQAGPTLPARGLFLWDVQFPEDVYKRQVFQNPDNQIVATVVEEDVAFALEHHAHFLANVVQLFIGAGEMCIRDSLLPVLLCYSFRAIPHNSRLTAQAPLRRLRHGICAVSYTHLTLTTSRNEVYADSADGP